MMNAPKIFAIPVTLYVEAFDKKIAEGCAEITAFKASEHLREPDNYFVRMPKDKFIVNGEAVEVASIPEKDYDKVKIIEAFGEDKGIRFLNY
jgi:hypothetical protein